MCFIAIVFINEETILLKLSSGDFRGSHEPYFAITGVSSYTMTLDVDEPLEILGKRYLTLVYIFLKYFILYRITFPDSRLFVVNPD